MRAAPNMILAESRLSETAVLVGKEIVVVSNALGITDMSESCISDDFRAVSASHVLTATKLILTLS